MGASHLGIREDGRRNDLVGSKGLFRVNERRQDLGAFLAFRCEVAGIVSKWLCDENVKGATPSCGVVEQGAGSGSGSGRAEILARWDLQAIDDGRGLLIPMAAEVVGSTVDETKNVRCRRLWRLSWGVSCERWRMLEIFIGDVG